MATVVKKEVVEQLYFAVEVEYEGEWGKAGKDVGYVKWIGSDAWCELECNQRADYVRDEIMTFFSCNNWLVKTIMLRGNSGCENYRHVVTDWLNLDDEQMFNHYVGTLESIGCIDIVADLITEADSKVDDEQYVFAPEEVLPGLELTFRIFETHTYGSNNTHDWDTYIAYIDLVSNDHWNGLTPAQRKEWMVENAKLVGPAEGDFKFSHFVVDSAGDEQYLYSFSSENVPETVFEYTAEELIASTHIAPVWEFDAFHEGYETHAEWLVVYYPELVATEDEVESEMVFKAHLYTDLNCKELVWECTYCGDEDINAVFASVKQYAESHFPGWQYIAVQEIERSTGRINELYSFTKPGLVQHEPQ
jgi:hypothetical protein